MRWLHVLSLLLGRAGHAVCAGLFLRVGPCHFDFEIDRARVPGTARS